MYHKKFLFFWSEFLNKIWIFEAVCIDVSYRFLTLNKIKTSSHFHASFMWHMVDEKIWLEMNLKYRLENEIMIHNMYLSKYYKCRVWDVVVSCFCLHLQYKLESLLSLLEQKQ